VSMALRTASVVAVVLACGGRTGAAPVTIEAVPARVEPSAPTLVSQPVAPVVAAPERSPFEVRLAALAGWLSGHADVDLVASWRSGDRQSWVRDASGLTFCVDGRCWREAARPEIVTVLDPGEDPPIPGTTWMGWGPASGEIEAWEYDPETARKRRLGTLTARAREPTPFWWRDRSIELVIPGKAWTMPVTAPPHFGQIGLTPRGKPGEWEAWSTIVAPEWALKTEGLEIWPFRSTGDVVALWVTASDRTEGRIGVCARLGRWRCALLERPAERVDERAPVRAEVVGASGIVVEIAEFDDPGPSSGRAELHVLAIDPADALVAVGAWTTGGLTGTFEQLGMYRSTYDLDYRFVERAYQPWTIEGECVRFGPLVGEELATGHDFGRLSDFELKQWKVRGGGKLPKPREPRALAPAAARRLIAGAAILEKNRLAEPDEELQAEWRVASGTVARGCGR
jgi:hypothetical protein